MSDSDEEMSFTESVSNGCLSESHDSGETEVESWNRSTLCGGAISPHQRFGRHQGGELKLN